MKHKNVDATINYNGEFGDEVWLERIENIFKDLIDLTQVKIYNFPVNYYDRYWPDASK